MGRPPRTPADKASSAARFPAAASRRFGRRRREAGSAAIVFGVEPIRELVAAWPDAVRTLYVRPGHEARLGPAFDELRRRNARIIAAEPATLDRIAGPGARHQGVVALIREYPYTDFEEVLDEKPDPLLVVDGVTDPRNLGALLRSAEGAGARAVVLARDRTVGITPVAVKASAGAWAHLRIARCTNVARALSDLKRAGYWIAALAPAGQLSLYDLDTTARLALVVGAEDRGVREIVRRAADFVVHIPMRGRVKSLNVSVAAAVAMFEIARRRAGGAADRP